MLRRGRLVVVVVTFLIGCVVLLVVGCAGTSSETSKKEQGRSPEATASEEQPRCEGTRTIRNPLDYQDVSRGIRVGKTPFTTNDLPDCPKGGLLLGTNKADELAGEDGEDELRGLGDNDVLGGGVGDDVIHGGPGDDDFIAGKGDDILYGGLGRDNMTLVGSGEDVIYGGDGNDVIDATYRSGDRDRLYCGKGKDLYTSDKKDYVDSSCEKKEKSMWGTL